MTCKDAAKRLGVSRVTLHKALNDGRIHGVCNVLNPARYIGITIDEIERVEKARNERDKHKSKV